ncbi:MAG TPA: transcriptional regulator [Spirochaetia bacterium]|nr:transcriptional regulator [Spirochaetia bacterium]
MKVSTRTRYGLRLLSYLAIKKRICSLSEIARHEDISEKYLEQIMLLLRKTGAVKSMRGNNGGYRLAKRPAALSLEPIVEALEGSFHSAPCAEKIKCLRQETCPLSRVWKAFNRQITMFFRRRSVADISLRPAQLKKKKKLARTIKKQRQS